MSKTWRRTSLVGILLIVVLVVNTIHSRHTLAQEASETQTAIFAGGCFWCMEEAFEKVKGVHQVVSGYTGGVKERPTYEQVSAGGTGHFEAIEVEYDPSQIGYGQLLEVFWHNIDPTDGAGQFCDKGTQYRAAIFYRNEDEKRLAEESQHALEMSKPFPESIATQILPASTFYPAEGYHQDYYRKNPVRYRYYKWGCGRAQRLEELWGPPQK